MVAVVESTLQRRSRQSGGEYSLHGPASWLDVRSRPCITISAKVGEITRGFRHMTSPFMKECRSQQGYRPSPIFQFKTESRENEGPRQGSLETDRRLVARGSDSPLSIRLSVTLRANDYNSANPAGFSKSQESSGSMNDDEE